MEEIIATHIVKPSSPTPTHLKTVKLSSLDQLSPSNYVPVIYFYDNHGHESTETISHRLRQSLSEILSMFYPFAGKLRQNSFIECDDEGAVFVEARLHARLSHFTQQPQMEKVEKLIPTPCSPHKDDRLLSVKATYFDCGGVAIGVCFSHIISDAASFFMFMNAWAATCRGEASGITPPSFDLAQHFPPSPINMSSLSGFLAGPTEETMVRRRLVLEREKLEKIRQRVAGWSDEVKDPSTVEALSALIWRSFIQAYKSRYGSRQETTPSFMAAHSIHLRPRTAPRIRDRTFGNCLSVVSAVVSGGEVEEESGVYVSRLRAAIRGVDADFINNVIKHREFFSTAAAIIAGISKHETLFMTSWWRFPMYEADFGWGKPVWVCRADMEVKNRVFLMSTPSGDGIEMWISLPDEEFFQMFQANCNDILIASVKVKV